MRGLGSCLSRQCVLENNHEWDYSLRGFSPSRRGERSCHSQKFFLFCLLPPTLSTILGFSFAVIQSHSAFLPTLCFKLWVDLLLRGSKVKGPASGLDCQWDVALPSQWWNLRCRELASPSWLRWRGMERGEKRRRRRRQENWDRADSGGQRGERFGRHFQFPPDHVLSCQRLYGRVAQQMNGLLRWCFLP